MKTDTRTNLLNIFSRQIPGESFRAIQHGTFRYLLFFLLVITVALLVACGRPPNSDLIIKAEEADEAYISKVYFLRPMPLKFRKYSDNPIKVTLNGEYLLEIAEGEYHLARLQPMQGNISTHSLTFFTNHTAPQEISRSRQFNFVAGKTYFILLKRVNEEFRGVFYVPEPIDLSQAKQIAYKLNARRYARQARIDDIESVPETDPPKPVNPALPEQLYPGEKYLIKGTPEYKPPEIPEDKNEITFDKEPEEKIKRPAE